MPTNITTMPFAPKDRPVMPTPQPTKPGMHFKYNGVWKQDPIREAALRELHEVVDPEENFLTFAIKYSPGIHVVVVPEPQPTFIESFRNAYRSIPDFRKNSLVALIDDDEAHHEFIKTPEFLGRWKYDVSYAMKIDKQEVGMLDAIPVRLLAIDKIPLATMLNGKVKFYYKEDLNK